VTFLIVVDSQHSLKTYTPKMVTAVSGARFHWSLLCSHLSAAFIEYGVVLVLRYYRTFTAWMHTSLVVISSIPRIANINMQFHVVSGQDMPISSAPLTTKDGVHAFLTRYPEAPKDSFHQTIFPVRGTYVAQLSRVKFIAKHSLWPWLAVKQGASLK